MFIVLDVAEHALIYRRHAPEKQPLWQKAPIKKNVLSAIEENAVLSFSAPENLIVIVPETNEDQTELVLPAVLLNGD